MPQAPAHHAVQVDGATKITILPQYGRGRTGIVFTQDMEGNYLGAVVVRNGPSLEFDLPPDRKLTFRQEFGIDDGYAEVKISSVCAVGREVCTRFKNVLNGDQRTEAQTSGIYRDIGMRGPIELMIWEDVEGSAGQ